MGLLLALDVGNTNTVIGFFQGDALVATARLTTVRERTSDEHSLFLRAVIEAKGRKVEEIDDVIVSSVVPSQDFPIRTACRDAFGIDPLFVAPGVKTGMKILYDHPSEVGADRIVNAVAAVAAHGAPCIVVDFGTATTFDVVTAAGDYLGGVICPGHRHQRRRPLLARGAALPRRPPPAREGGGEEHRPEHPVGSLLGRPRAGGGAHRPHSRRARRAEDEGRRHGRARPSLLGGVSRPRPRRLRPDPPRAEDPP